MGTTVIYNGVTLHNVQTREWSQSVRYDDSGTDAMFHVFSMKFEGLLHSEYQHTSTTSVAVAPTVNMPVQYVEVQRRLLKPRQQLEVYVSSSETFTDSIPLFLCGPAPGEAGTIASVANMANLDRDVDNGPKPKNFRVLQIIGAKCLRVAFEIECAKLVCQGGVTINASGSALGVMPVVLSNRWTVDESMDENLFITRTIAGEMRLSTAVSATKILAKSLVVPGLENGFRRTGLDFSVDKTGLECTYRIVDKQVHTAAPWPATKLNARHSQSTSDGINMISEVSVEIEGPPAADKKMLLARALQVVDAKLNFAVLEAQFRKRYMPEHISITDYIGDTNRIEVLARFLETPGDDVGAVQQMFGNLRKHMGSPLQLPDVSGHSYDPMVSMSPPIYGYNPPSGSRPVGTERRPSILLLLQCYLQQPCYDVHGIAKFQGTPIGDDSEEDKPPYVPEQPTEYPEGSLPEYQPGQWSESAKAYIYTYARVCNRYQTNECRVQLPIAQGAQTTPPRDTSIVFRLASGQCQRIIDSDVERAGTWPEIPPAKDTFTDGTLRGTLLRHWVDSHPPTLTADGVTPLYRLTAHYVYAMNRPPTIGESYRVGVAPQTKFQKTGPEVQFDPAVAYANQELEP